MVQFMKLLVTIALTFAITTTIITTTTSRTNTATKTVVLEYPFKDSTPPPPGAVMIRRSRFLAQKDDEGQGHKARNLNAADSCNKDSEICRSTGANSRMACCNNKCMDLSTDNKNCGACNKKCKYEETCCGGRCVNLNFNKRHCGKCNQLCKQGGVCLYGLCDYA